MGQELVIRTEYVAKGTLKIGSSLRALLLKIRNAKGKTLRSRLYLFKNTIVSQKARPYSCILKRYLCGSSLPFRLSFTLPIKVKVSPSGIIFCTLSHKT